MPARAGWAALRGLAVCYACAALLGLTIGLAMPLVAVALDARGFGEAAIGVSAAAQFLGIMAGAPLGPWLIPRRGLRFSMAAALVAGAAALALMPAAGAVYAAWLALRFVFGAAEGLMFVATETWINQAVSDRSRGRAVSLYTASLAGGVALGPLLIAATGTDGVAPFLVGAAALLAGLALLGLAAGTAPRIGGARSFGILGYLAALPVAVAAAALFGFADGGLIAMLTVYGLGLGMDEVSSARLVTVLVVGGIVLMPLVGWIIDRVDRRRLVVVCAGLAALAIAAVPFLAASTPALWAALFALGGLLGAFWLVAMALMGERFRGTDLAAANVGLTFAYGVGSILGPAVAGAALEAWPPHGMMAAMAAGVGAFALWGAARGRGAERPPPTSHSREPA